MFLIQYDKGRYVNGELIESVTFDTSGGDGIFVTTQSKEYVYVGSDYVEVFLNNLQAINDNACIETAYRHLHNKK